MTTTKGVLSKGKTFYMYSKEYGVMGSFFNFKDDLEIEIIEYGTEENPLINCRITTNCSSFSLWGDRYEIK